MALLCSTNEERCLEYVENARNLLYFRGKLSYYMRTADCVRRRSFRLSKSRLVSRKFHGASEPLVRTQTRRNNSAATAIPDVRKKENKRKEEPHRPCEHSPTEKLDSRCEMKRSDVAWLSNSISSVVPFDEDCTRSSATHCSCNLSVYYAGLQDCVRGANARMR